MIANDLQKANQRCSIAVRITRLLCIQALGHAGRSNAAATSRTHGKRMRSRKVRPRRVGARSAAGDQVEDEDSRAA
jgi:hypothetical protein